MRSSSNFLKLSFFWRFRQLARRVSKGLVASCDSVAAFRHAQNSVSGVKCKHMARSSVGSVRKSKVVADFHERPAIASLQISLMRPDAYLCSRLEISV
jgi:hypothetical protein